MEPRCDEADRAVAVSVTGSERVRRDGFLRFISCRADGRNWTICVKYASICLYVAKHIRNTITVSPATRRLRVSYFDPSRTLYRGPYAVHARLPGSVHPRRAPTGDPARTDTAARALRRGPDPAIRRAPGAGRWGNWPIRAGPPPAPPYNTTPVHVPPPYAYRASRAEGRSAKGEGAATSTHRSIRAPKARAPQGGFNPAGLKLRKPEET